MKVLSKIFLWYCLIAAIFIVVSVANPVKAIFLPLLLFLACSAFGRIFRNRTFVGFFTGKLFLYYNFILVCILVAAGFLGATSTPQLISAFIFSPLVLYFGGRVLPRKKQALSLPAAIQQQPPPTATKVVHPKDFDQQRRTFIKLVGSAGLSLFFFSIFTKKAQAAFFGSVPGPGTVAVKDIAGNQIDPAQNQPTDGYKISELDDASPAYYGFLEKAGAWYILKEDASGTYRYSKGTSNFSTNWTNRASLTYDYYHNVF